MGCRRVKTGSTGLQGHLAERQSTVPSHEWANLCNAAMLGKGEVRGGERQDARSTVSTVQIPMYYYGQPA